MTETTDKDDLHYDVVHTMMALEEGEIEHEKAIEQLTLACKAFLGISPPMVGEEPEVTKIEHIWCEEDDRWLYIETHRDGIGINYRHGNDYEKFKEHHCKPDKALSAFYAQARLHFDMHTAPNHSVDYINATIWLWFETTCNILEVSK